MTDLRTRMVAGALGQAPRFDWAIEDRSLAPEEGLVSAIMISLFTDRQALEDDAIPDGTTNRRGWWADPTLGSRLWLLEREKDLQSVVLRAEEYCVEALAWLTENGIARRVDIVTGWVNQAGLIVETKPADAMPGVLGIGVTVYRPDGNLEEFRFRKFWNGAI